MMFILPLLAQSLTFQVFEVDSIMCGRLISHWTTPSQIALSICLACISIPMHLRHHIDLLYCMCSPYSNSNLCHRPLDLETTGMWIRVCLFLSFTRLPMKDFGLGRLTWMRNAGNLEPARKISRRMKRLSSGRGACWCLGLSEALGGEDEVVATKNEND